jgi:hypothetical protein
MRLVISSLLCPTPRILGHCRNVDQLPNSAEPSIGGWKNLQKNRFSLSSLIQSASDGDFFFVQRLRTLSARFNGFSLKMCQKREQAGSSFPMAIALSFSSSDDDVGGPNIEPVSPPRVFSDRPPERMDSVFVIDSYSDSDSDARVVSCVPRGTFRFSVKSHLTIRGIRIHFQLCLNGYPLFHSKLKSRSPSSAVGISSGSSAHFSQPQFAGFLIPSEHRSQFILKQNSMSGPELMDITFSYVKGLNPKQIRIRVGDRLYVNEKPTKDIHGHWCVSFGGKLAIPSVKNCVIIPEHGSRDYAMQMRRVSASDCELDSAGIFSPLCLFGYAIAAFLSPI